MFTLRLTEQQFSWLLSHIENKWNEKTTSILRDHFVNNLSKMDCATKYDVSLQHATKRINQFEERVEQLAHTGRIKISTVIHLDETSITGKIQKYDVTHEQKDFNQK